MTSMWDYQQGVGRADRDLVGYDVAPSTGIGKVDEATYEAGRRYLVVDTGFWIFGRKRMLPAGVVDRVAHADHKVYVAMSKEDIKSAPDFNDHDRNVRDPYDACYSRSVVDRELARTRESTYHGAERAAAPRHVHAGPIATWT